MFPVLRQHTVIQLIDNASSEHVAKVGDAGILGTAAFEHHGFQMHLQRCISAR